MEWITYGATPEGPEGLRGRRADRKALLSQRSGDGNALFSGEVGGPGGEYSYGRDSGRKPVGDDYF